MNKDIKILMVALVIIIIGAVSFNYMNTTGKVISKGTVIVANPKVVKASEYIYFNVNPGKQGVYQEIEIYRDNDKKLGYKADVCRASKCFEKATIKYKILDNWDNNDKWSSSEVSRDYYARVYDIYSGKYVRTYFTVKRAYETRGPSSEYS